MAKYLINKASSDYNNQFVIDFERGCVVHSSAMSPIQYDRYIRTQSSKTRWDLNHRQASMFFNVYAYGQRYLQYLKQRNNKEIKNLISNSFLSFSVNTMNDLKQNSSQLAFPVVQIGYPGFVRTHKSQQGIYNFMKSRLLQLHTYGLMYTPVETKQQVVSRCTDKFRSIVFAKKAKKVQAESQQ